MKTVRDLLALKCFSNWFKVVVWNKENKITKETKRMYQCDLYPEYLDYVLLDFGVKPELQEEPSYFMNEEMRLMIVPVITLNVREKEK